MVDLPEEGLGGEIAIMIANLFELSLRQSIFFIQSLTHIYLFIFSFFLFKKLKSEYYSSVCNLCSTFFIISNC